MGAVVVFLPLIGALLAGVLAFVGTDDRERQTRIDTVAQWLSCGSLIISAALAIFVFVDVVIDKNAHTIELFTWIDSGALEVSWALKLDTLSVVMLLTVTVVSATIHVYSIGYMQARPGHPPVHVVSKPVHLLHADAGERRQPGPALFRLGRGRTSVLSPDRLLVRSARGERRRHQGVHGEPGRWISASRSGSSRLIFCSRACIWIPFSRPPRTAPVRPSPSSAASSTR